MKYIKKYLTILVILISCSCIYKPHKTNDNLEIKSNHSVFTDTLSLIDSLDRFNYFDYFGKTLEEALEDIVIKQFTGYFIEENPPGCFAYLDLNYGKFGQDNFRVLRFYFSDMHNDNTRCLNKVYEWRIESLLNKEIKNIHYTVNGWNRVTTDSIREQEFIQEIKKIDFSTYYGHPIDTLWGIPIIHNSVHRKFFIDHNQDDCLDYIGLNYKLSNYKILMIFITPDLYEHMNPCIDKYKEYWNLNEFRKETLKEVKVIIN